jgi:short-subunit dehydrogenase
MNKTQLRGRVVVITGASSGFGRGTALRFAREGASVVLAARRGQVLDELEEHCKRSGARALACPTDVSQQSQVIDLVRAAIGEFGRIDVWVNNAGSAAVGRFDQVPLEDHIRVIQTDLCGTLYGSYCAMRQFRDQRAGTLINVASVIGKVPAPYFASYAAAKHGIIGLSGSLRLELKQDGFDSIHVCTVIPTSFDTPFFEHAAQYTGHKAEPIPPTYIPQDVVETIFRLATKPEDEVAVGAAAKVATLAHQFFPGMVETVMARKTRRAEFDNAPPAENSPGTLYGPKPDGKGVSGGRRHEAFENAGLEK